MREAAICWRARSAGGRSLRNEAQAVAKSGEERLHTDSGLRFGSDAGHEGAAAQEEGPKAGAELWRQLQRDDVAEVLVVGQGVISEACGGQAEQAGQEKHHQRVPGLAVTVRSEPLVVLQRFGARGDQLRLGGPVFVHLEAQVEEDAEAAGEAVGLLLQQVRLGLAAEA